MSVASLASKKYDDQIHFATNMQSQSATASDFMAVMNCIANEIEGYIFYDTDMDDCMTDLRFSRHI